MVKLHVVALIFDEYHIYRTHTDVTFTEQFIGRSLDASGYGTLSSCYIPDDQLDVPLLKSADVVLLVDFPQKSEVLLGTYLPLLSPASKRILWCWDFAVDGDIRWVNDEIIEHVDAVVPLDRPEIPAGATRLRERYVTGIWPPYDAQTFYDDGRPFHERDIDVLFLGQPRPERQQFIAALQQAGIPVTMAGGRFAPGTPCVLADCGDYLRRTKLALDFTSHPTRPAMKARTFEIAACGACIIHLKFHPDPIDWYFTDDVEYVGGDTICGYRITGIERGAISGRPAHPGDRELVHQIRYYLHYPEIASMVARAGHDRCVTQYTSERFWHRVFTHIGVL